MTQTTALITRMYSPTKPMQVPISNLIAQDPQCDKVSYSVEFFPPKTEAGETILILKMPNFLGKNLPQPPAFLDITWGAGGSTSTKTLHWVREFLTHFPETPVNMHITCTNMNKDVLDAALSEASELGVLNLVALRGDLPKDAELDHSSLDSGHFRYGSDLVRYLRAHEPQRWHITVGGYPEGHPDTIETISSEADLASLTETEISRMRSDPVSGLGSVCRDQRWAKELEHLHKKVAAGADMVISQLFFEPRLFLRFLEKAREIGIECPILPGIMLIQDYDGFQRITSFCKTHVPQWIFEGLEEVREDPTRVREFGVKVALKMVKELYDGGVRHFHFYALNRTEVYQKVVEKLLSMKAELES